MLIAAWTNIDGLKDGKLAVVGLGDVRFEVIGRTTSMGEAKRIAADASMEFYATRIVWPGSSCVWTERMEIDAEDAADDAAAEYWMQVAQETGAKMKANMAEAEATMDRIGATLHDDAKEAA